MAKFCTECGKEIKEGVAFCTECGTKAPADPAVETTETVTEAKETKVETPVVHTPPAQSYQPQQQIPPQPPQQQIPPQPPQQQIPPQPPQQAYPQPQQAYPQPQQAYPQPQQVYAQPVYQQPVYAQPAADPTTKVASTGTYFGLMLLFALPIIGFIACIIMAFAPKNKNIKHFARAMLIWTIIGLVIGGLLVAGLMALSNVLTDLINQATGGELGELIDQLGGLGDLLEQLGGLGDLLEQLGDLGDLTDQLDQIQDTMDQIPTDGLEGLPVE